VLTPGSPGNLWVLERDGAALRALVEQTVARFGLDPARVYVTGFSNGAIMTLQMATTHPDVFAACSPWNSPGEAACVASGLGAYVVRPGFGAAGVEMPAWIAYGDSDAKASVACETGLAELTAANGCAGAGEALGAGAYRAEDGYAEGERLATTCWRTAAGSARVALTVMRDMPHGAIPDEARAAWEFMSRFSRPEKSVTVEEDMR